jgi:two-component system chemotaxis sensor kinase CheA
MLDMYLFETTQNIEQLEALILSSEKSGVYTQVNINEIFRIMHTIKGSSAMMLFNNISSLAHVIEDMFYYLREKKPGNVDYPALSDLILDSVDFIKVELEKVKANDEVDGDYTFLEKNIKEFLALLKHQNTEEVELVRPASIKKQHFYIAPEKNSLLEVKNTFKATMFFEEGCEMENIRAYTVVHNLKEFTEEIFFLPEDIIDNDESVQVIRTEGFHIFVKADKSFEEMHKFLRQTIFLKDLELVQLENDEEFVQLKKNKKLIVEDSPIKVPKLQTQACIEQVGKEVAIGSVNQSIISVNVEKLDKLMDLVGEMVIAEAMVTQNPDIKDLQLDNFRKAARQLHKITSELQDTVMSIRMVPLVTTFQKMHRIVRDMCKKLDKDVQLTLIGEDTEVDKNIIEHISDPLMHLVRNSIDHGIEVIKEREEKGKSKVGTITLEAKNSGSDVLVIIKDDGKGLNKEKIMQRAIDHGLLTKPEQEMTDREIFNLIFLPGFSTKDSVTEFSGRGVGMDVVTKNIESVGGAVSIDSVEGLGTTITLKIPLTLAIIDGMNIRVGSSCYTIPTTAIRQSFRPVGDDIIKDPDDNEMIMVRGECYPILRLHEHFSVKSELVNFTEGILIMVEQNEKSLCIFADELLGQQQVVVKTLPSYIKNIRNVRGLAGCTLLGDGSISLILDIDGLINKGKI